jgi:hypothetical protein
MAGGASLLDLLGLTLGIDNGLGPDPVDPDPVDPGDGFRVSVGQLREVNDREHLLVYRADHESRAFDLLYWQHKSVKRIPALARSFAAGAQVAELLSWTVILGTSTIAGAQGVHLDRWGAIVGEARGGLSEDDYRRFIDLRIRVNTDVPSNENLLEVLVESIRPSTVTSNPVADGEVHNVESVEWLPDAIKDHARGLIRDFRPVGFYHAVTEFKISTFAVIGTIADPGATIGTIADPGPWEIGRLIYDGRSRV